MNNDIINAGVAFGGSRQAYEEHKRQRNAALNPPKRKPPLLAVRITNGGRLIQGKRREAGELVPIWPEEIPAGFLSKETAAELIGNGLAVAATPEELQAFLDHNEQPNPADQ